MVHTDSYLFFTDCHRLYVHGVRVAIRNRLMSVFDKDWWEWGVMLAVSEDQRTLLRDFIRKDQSREQHLLLDPTHFRPIIAKNHNRAFADAFTDVRKAAVDLQTLVRLRNEWAHTQEIPWGRARLGAELMKHILASLQLDEAVEVDNMIRDSAKQVGDDTLDDALEDLGDPVSSFAPQVVTADPWAFWHEIQSCLQLTTDVQYTDDDFDSEARVTITVHNSAPNSKNLPAIHFGSVTINNGPEPIQELGAMAPGDTRQAVFLVPKPQLAAVDYSISGQVDADHLLNFQLYAALPKHIIAPIQKRLLDGLESIGIREFINEVLEFIGTPDENTPFSVMGRIRESLGERQEQTEAKREALSQFLEEFYVDADSFLGSRIQEIIEGLDAFDRQLIALNEAIGRTSSAQIAQAVQGLRQVQLAVVRVEDAVKNIATQP